MKLQKPTLKWTFLWKFQQIGNNCCWKKISLIIFYVVYRSIYMESSHHQQQQKCNICDQFFRKNHYFYHHPIYLQLYPPLFLEFSNFCHSYPTLLKAKFLKRIFDIANNSNTPRLAVRVISIHHWLVTVKDSTFTSWNFKDLPWSMTSHKGWKTLT